MGEWQPIETAPKDGTRVLLFDRYCREADHARYVGAWTAEYNGHWYAIPGAFSKKPTHWQPIPEPPK